MNLFSFLLLLGFLIVQYASLAEASYLARGIAFAIRHPEVLRDIAVFSLSGSVAQIFIFGCLEDYGSFQTTSICTARKIMTVLVSVFGSMLGLGFKKKDLGFVQWVGIFNVFLGLIVQVYCGSDLELAFRSTAKEAVKKD